MAARRQRCANGPGCLFAADKIILNIFVRGAKRTNSHIYGCAPHTCVLYLLPLGAIKTTFSSTLKANRNGTIREPTERRDDDVQVEKYIVKFHRKFAGWWTWMWNRTPWKYDIWCCPACAYFLSVLYLQTLQAHPTICSMLFYFYTHCDEMKREAHGILSYGREDESFLCSKCVCISFQLTWFSFSLRRVNASSNSAIRVAKTSCGGVRWCETIKWNETKRKK